MRTAFQVLDGKGLRECLNRGLCGAEEVVELVEEALAVLLAEVFAPVGGRVG